MADSAADVGPRYDVLIDGHGYLLLNALDASIPFRTHRGIYSYSPTFVERQNVGTAYGDNSQDFFLTASQNDFSLGEAQRFFRISDQDRVRRYWTGQSIDPVTIPGQVALRKTVGSLTFAAAVRAVAEINSGSSGVYAASASNLYLLDATGGITDKGAHGLGATPSQWGLATDAANAYVSTTAGGTAGVRKYNGAAWSLFSASGADSLTYLNNTLYGYRESAGDLVRWDTVGNLATQFVWKDASGNALTGSGYATRLRAYGGKLLMMRQLGVRGRGEIWQYTDAGAAQLCEFPANFVARELEVVSGIALVSGYISRNADVQPAIFYLLSTGTLGLLWRSNVSGYTNPTWPALTAYGDGVAFTDDSTGNLMIYNIAAGGVHTVGGYTVTNQAAMMAASKDVLLHTRNATAAYYFPTTTTATSGFLVTSLVDFENSLTKQFRGVKVDFDAPAGATVDIAYQVDSVDGSWTTLQTGAVSGTQYSLSGVSGRSIALKITLNKGSSANGPVLKRWYVLAAPQLQSFRHDELIIDLSGRDGKTPLKLRDGADQPLDGLQMAINLRAAITAASPVSVTDRFGTYNAMFEPDTSELYETRPEEFIARVRLREV